MRRRTTGPPVSRRSPAIAGRRRKRRAVREVGRRRDPSSRRRFAEAGDEEREKESTAKSVTPMPDVQDGQTADGGQAGGGKKEAAGGRFGARQAAIRSNPPPSVRAFSPDARRPPPGGRRKRSTRPACEHKRRGPAPTLPSPASSRARSLTGRAKMLAQCVPRVREQASHCASIAARGNHRCTRDDGTADHAAKRNAGSGQVRERAGTQ